MELNHDYLLNMSIDDLRELNKTLTEVIRIKRMELKQRLILIGYKEDITEVLNGIKSPERVIDFDVIIPTPVDLLFTPHIDAIIAYKAGYETPPDYLKQKEDFNRIMSNMAKYGFSDWREWRVENWGFIDNAYNTKMDDENFIVEFSTNQTPAIIVIHKLSNLYPKVGFKLTWSDESLNFKNGLVLGKL